MPDIYINNTKLTFNKIIYVDSILGNDLNDGESVESPYKTLQHAINNASEGNAIVLAVGLYNITGFNNLINNITYIGLPKAIIEIEQSQEANKDIIASFYNIIFRPSAIYQATYAYTFFRGGGSVVRNFNLCFYNCVFEDPYEKIQRGQRHSSYICADNSTAIMHNYENLKFENCISFDIPIVTTWNDPVGTDIKVINCATNFSSLKAANSETGLSRNVEIITSLVNAQFDSEYNIISSGWQYTGTGVNADGTQAHIGVYGGIFQWVPFIVYYLVESEGEIYNCTEDCISTGLTEPLTKNDFMTYGSKQPPNMQYVKGLISPKLLVFSTHPSTPKIIIKKPYKLTDIYYAISIDNITYYSYRNGVWFPVTDIYNEGMTEEEIEALTVEDFAKIFVPGNLYIKAVLKSNDKNETPAIYSIKVTFPSTYTVGSYYIITDNAMQLNTLDWKQINSCIIEQTTPTDTDVRYAFSNNNKETWQVYKNNSWSTITLNNISTEGMTKEEVESLTSKEWKGILKNTLDVAICLLSENESASPEVDQITFDYDRIDSPMVSNVIRLPVPETGFRYVLEVDDSYTLKIAQGIAFDDAEIDYDFYTTPNKIKLRPLDMGNVTGGKYSDIYAVEVINGYENDDFNIILYASKGGQDAEPKGSYGLFHDAERETNRTWIEFSFTGGAEFNPTYPLQFRLDRDSSKIFYVRIKPTLTTTGYDTFQIRLIGRAV